MIADNALKLTIPLWQAHDYLTLRDKEQHVAARKACVLFGAGLLINFCLNQVHRPTKMKLHFSQLCFVRFQNREFMNSCGISFFHPSYGLPRWYCRS